MSKQTKKPASRDLTLTNRQRQLIRKIQRLPIHAQRRTLKGLELMVSLVQGQVRDAVRAGQGPR